MEWDEKTLDDVCLLITDGAHNSPKSVDVGFPMASVKDMTPHGINVFSCRQISEEDYYRLVHHKCQPIVGDVLIAKDGNSALDTVCEITAKVDLVLLSSVAILRPNPNQITSTFLRYYLDCETTRQYLKQGFISGAAIPRVILKDFKRARITVPPLPTQQKIASILSAYDDLIENNTRRIAILEEMAQAIYREWFVNFRFPGHENVKLVDSPLGQIPKGWEATQVGDLCTMMRAGGTPLRKRDEYWSGGTVDWYKTKELWDGFLFDSEEKITEFASTDSTTRMFDPETILMAIYGSPTVGRMGILTRRSACNQAALAMVPDPNKASVPFLFHILLSLREHFNTIAMGAAQQNISKAKVVNASCVLPTYAIVEQFDAVCGPLFNLVKNISLKNRNLRTTRDLLLPKLISGKLGVEDLDIDLGLTAEALDEATA